MYLFGFILLIAAPAAEPLLVSRTAELGVEFHHQTGQTGSYLFPEITGAGAALADFNGDGRLDAYLVQSSSPGAGLSGAADQIYLSQPGLKALAPQPKLGPQGYSMGVAAGDVNNDGNTDLLLTQFGANQLLLGDGNGGFRDVTQQAGIAGEHWSTGATLVDLNRDGWLDLFIINYVDFPVDRNPACFSASGRRDYCGPAAFSPQRDQVLLNQGNGSFKDVTARYLGQHSPGPGLGVVSGDFDQDGWPDLFVANDGAHNHLWINQQGKTLSNEALFSGVAVNGRGVAEASMGVAIADFDEDGDEDLFLTHLMGETNTYYQNQGNLIFSDATQSSGLAAVSRQYTAWGTGPVDVNQDGWLDLVVFNGAVSIIESQLAGGQTYPYGQRNQVFMNRQGTRFDQTPASALPAEFLLPLSSRGAAFGDLDNNGALDILVSNNNGPAQLFAAAPSGGHWLGLDLRSTEHRPVVGSWVELTLDDGTVMHRRVRSSGSYASANDSRLLFHFGGRSPVSISVRWPDGELTEHELKELNRYHKLFAPR